MSPADTSPPCNPLGKFKEQISPQIRPFPPPSPTHHLNHVILSVGLKASFQALNDIILLIMLVCLHFISSFFLSLLFQIAYVFHLF